MHLGRMKIDWLWNRSYYHGFLSKIKIKNQWSFHYRTENEEADILAEIVTGPERLCAHGDRRKEEAQTLWKNYPGKETL